MTLSQADLVTMYQTMLLIRRFEEQATQFYLNGQIRGSFHPCIGQEGTAAGACAALRQDDYIFCTYRGHGQSLAKGLDPKEAMAELLGKATGCSQGKGGSMHFTDPRVGLLGENAIVGASAPLAVGAALSAQLDHLDRVAVAFFGEGALNQGALLEAFNLAAVWQAPVIFFCENNLYSEMTPIREAVRVDRLTQRAEGFGIGTATVDGYDPLAVYETTRAAVERARGGGGPSFIEAFTYRLVGHMVGDTEVYRTKQEVAEWRARDPIAVFPRRLEQEFGVSPDEIRAADERAAAQIAEAVKFATESPWPEPASVADDVFAPA